MSPSDETQQCIWCALVVPAPEVVDFNYQGGLVYVCKTCAVQVNPYELKTKLREKVRGARR